MLKAFIFIMIISLGIFFAYSFQGSFGSMSRIDIVTEYLFLFVPLAFMSLRLFFVKLSQVYVIWVVFFIGVSAFFTQVGIIEMPTMKSSWVFIIGVFLLFGFFCSLFMGKSRMS